MLLWLQGEIRCASEPPAGAAVDACSQQALTLAVALGMRPLQAHCHRRVGMLYVAVGGREQSRSALSTAVELSRAMSRTLWLPQTKAALAQVAAR